MTLNRDLNAGTGKAEDLKGKQGRKRVLTDELKSLNKQLELYRQRKQGLVIRSPIDGVVVTWDLKKKIEDRYVQKGWLLLSVADPTKDWQLELHMPEQRMGHIAKEQQKLFEKSREKLRQLLTEEAKATLPATPESAEAIAATESAAATETPGTAEATTTPEEKISAWVEAELAKVPPDQSFNKCLELINARFHKQIEELAAATPEGEIRDKLKDILSCESYGQAQSKLGELLAGKEEIDPELKAKLTPLQNKDLEGKLEVKYYLATDSSKTHVGWVKEIHRSAEIMGEEGNTVLIKVAINKEEISEQLQQGATVGAKSLLRLSAVGLRSAARRLRLRSNQNHFPLFLDKITPEKNAQGEIMKYWLALVLFLGCALSAAAQTAKPMLPGSVLIEDCSIVPDEQAEISAQEAGVLTAIPTKDGGNVKKNDVIVQIDDVIPKMQIEVAVAKMAAAKEEAENQTSIN